MRTGLLIAEADAELRSIYERLSCGLGFPVETAADGLECWTKLRSRPPDALIVDVEIPWGGGEGVLACLRDEAGDQQVPAVFVTGDDSPEVLSRRFGIPLKRCFQKPFHLGWLVDSACAAIAAGRQCEAISV